MVLMVAIGLFILGLCLGSFVNALVWRIHEQAVEARKKKSNKAYLAKLSVKKGRSMCPNCKHELAPQDLIPLISWLSLKGRCRYCGKPISIQYPLVELLMALVFVASYIWWPAAFVGITQFVLFGLWLAFLVGLVALLVYDFRWQLLPNRIIYPSSVIAVAIALIKVGVAGNSLTALANLVGAVAIGSGLFYVLYQVSNGRWIGGGDVRLGWILGLVAGTPGRSILLIFLASLIGSLISLPLLVNHKLQKTSKIPFGPLLIIAMIIVQLFGHSLLFWYQRTYLPFTI